MLQKLKLPAVVVSALYLASTVVVAEYDIHKRSSPTTSITTTSSQENVYSFEHYVEEFNKVYESEEEYNRRKIIFEENLNTINSHNRNEIRNDDGNARGQHKLGVNQFTDRILPDELPLGMDKSLTHGNFRFNSFKSLMKVVDLPAEFYRDIGNDDLLKKLPKSVDWRKDKPGIVTPVKNQGGCGSCWAL